VVSDAILGQMMESLELRRLDFGPLTEKDWAIRGKASHADGNRRWSNIGQGMLPSAQYPNRLSFWRGYNGKVRRMEENEVRYEVYHLDDAQLVLAAFGYVARVCQEALRRTRAKGLRVGSALARNMVLLGAYVESVKPVPVETVEGKINKRFGRDQELLSLNSGAFREGVKLAAKSSPKV